MRTSKVIILFTVILLYISCVGGKNSLIKPRHSLRGQREVLFINGDSMVYFINPIKLKSISGSYITADYTYLFSKKSPENQVKVSFTLTSKKQYEMLNSLLISYVDGNFETKTLNMMFQEMKAKDKFLIRYNFWIEKSKLQEICNSKSLIFKLNNKEEFVAKSKKWASQSGTIAQSLKNL